MRGRIGLLLIMAIGGFVGGAVCQELAVQKTGDWGTSFNTGVAVQGNYAYSAGWAGLDVVDLSDPVHPRKVGNYESHNRVDGLAVSDIYAYLTAQGDRFEVINVFNPSAPSLVTTLPVPWGKKVYISGNYAYVVSSTESNGTAIVNISNPLYPVVAGTLPTSDANAVRVKGNYAFVADGSNGLKVFNVSNPAAPSLVTTIPSKSAQDIDLSGDYLYLADSQEGLKILSIAKPESPVLAGSDTQAGHSIIAVSGSLVFTDGDGLSVYSVSNPASPTRLSTNPQITGTLNGIVISGNRAYPSVGWSGFYIVDISNPTTLSIRGVYDNCDYNNDFAMKGNVAFILRHDFSLEAVDFTNPLIPSVVSKVDEIGGYEIQIAGDLAYVTQSDGFEILNTSDAAAPKKVGSLQMGDYPRAPTIQGHYLYAVDRTKLLVADIANSASPSLVYSKDLEIYVTEDFYISGHYLYLTARFATSGVGLKIYDITSPSNPVLQSTLALDAVRYIAGQSNYAYITTGFGYIHVVNVTDPANPTLVKDVSVSGEGTRRIHVNGNYLFIGTDSAGLLVADISQPASPVVVGSYYTRDPQMVRFSGTAVYLEGGESGKIYALKTSNPTFDISHIAGGGDWKTFITIYNVTDNEQKAHYREWNNGTLAKDVVYTVPARNKRVLTDADFIGGGPARITTTDFNALVKVSYQYGNSQSLCEFFITSNSQAKRWIAPNPIRSWFDWFGLVVENPGDTDINLTFDAYKNSQRVGTLTQKIPPHQKFANVSQGLWNNLQYTDLDTVLITSDTAIPAPLSITGNNTNTRHVFFVAQNAEAVAGQKTYYFAHITDSSWNTSITAYNVEATPAQFQLYDWNADGSGQLVNGTSYTVPANGSFTLQAGNQLPFQSDGYITTSANLKFKLSYQYGTSASLCEFFLSDSLASTWILPNPIQPWFEWFGLAMANPSTSPVGTQFSAFKDGRILNSGTTSVGSHQRYVNLSNGIWAGINYSDVDMVTIDTLSPVPAPISITGNSANDRHVFFTGQSVQK